ncbi:MAG TPA: HD domain-containing protein, partial [Candidatus Sulfotelmatobacter sp.]|nr:HD domain-containing protein [Candidatus Sulfotelmatobacter sp.]
AGGKLIDDHRGQADLRAKIIRTVGDPLARFAEDGLRPLRACRFAATLEFTLAPATLAAIPQTITTYNKVAPERVHDELVKMLAAKRPSFGLELMRGTGLLKETLPELDACYGVPQPPVYHLYDVYWHSLHSCDAAPHHNLVVRLAALLHDLGKPSCKAGETFYNHDQVGAALADQALRRLKFGNAEVDQVVNLVRNHMFDYNSGWSEAAVRRFIRRVGGLGNIPDLFALRRADTAAMKQTVGSDYLDELQKRIDKIIAEEHALHVADLKVDGNDVMKTLQLKPGPQIGQVLNDLLEKVLDDPALNEREKLLELIEAHA